MCGFPLSACPWSALNNSVNMHQNEHPFLAFGSLISNAEVENQSCLIVSKFAQNLVKCNCCVSFFVQYILYESVLLVFN